MIVRISKGKFYADRAAEIEERLRRGEVALRPALEQLPGLEFYYVAIDRAALSITNTSVWDTLQHAQQLNTLNEMLEQRVIFEALGVHFEPITNHEVLWSMD